MRHQVGRHTPREAGDPAAPATLGLVPGRVRGKPVTGSKNHSRGSFPRDPSWKPKSQGEAAVKKTMVATNGESTPTNMAGDVNLGFPAFAVQLFIWKRSGYNATTSTSSKPPSNTLGHYLTKLKVNKKQPSTSPNCMLVKVVPFWKTILEPRLRTKPRRPSQELHFKPVGAMQGIRTQPEGTLPKVWGQSGFQRQVFPASIGRLQAKKSHGFCLVCFLSPPGARRGAEGVCALLHPQLHHRRAGCADPLRAARGEAAAGLYFCDGRCGRRQPLACQDTSDVPVGWCFGIPYGF